MAEMIHEGLLFGSKESFGIECSLLFRTDTPGRNLVGRLWFWFGGNAVGNSDVISLPKIMASELTQTLRWCGHRRNDTFFSMVSAEVLATIDNDIYGAITPSTGVGMERFLICMTPGRSEYMDGWLVAMIEGPEDGVAVNRVLIKHQSAPIIEVALPKREYEAVAKEFIMWLDKTDRELA